MKYFKVINIAFFIFSSLLIASTALPAEEQPLDLDWPDLVPPQMTREMARKGTILDENIKFGMRFDPAFFPLVEELSGKRIRMPGFALPLEFEGTIVKEFLLVPFVGACIHMPPPMPNQIVYATSNEGYESKTLYTPLYVTGTLQTKVGEFNLSFVDGSENVTASYYLSVDKMEPIEVGKKRK